MMLAIELYHAPSFYNYLKTIIFPCLSLVLFLLFPAYFLLRAVIETIEKRHTMAASFIHCKRISS